MSFQVCCYDYLDGAEVHGLFDDVMVVVKAERGRVHRFVEGPGVARVLLGQQLLQHSVAVAQLGAKFAAPHRRGQHRVRQVLFGGFNGPAAHSPSLSDGCFGAHHPRPTAHSHVQAHPRGQALIHPQAGVVIYPQRGECERRAVPTAQPHADAHGVHDGHSHCGRSGGVCFPLHTFFLKEKKNKIKSFGHGSLFKK